MVRYSREKSLLSAFLNTELLYNNVSAMVWEPVLEPVVWSL